MECSLLVSLPLFELRESEIQIVEEICTYLKKQNKLHSKKPAGIHHICHYLNILEYIEPKRQETLMEMIGLNDLKARGEFARLKQEAEKIGIEKTIPVLLDILTPEEISEKFDIELEKVLKIKNSNDK